MPYQLSPILSILTASSSAGAAGLLFFLSYIPVMTTDIGKLNIFLTLLSCLLNNIAMAMGFRQFADFEASGELGTLI